MPIQSINVGTTANDGTGDPLRTCFTKCNNNFSDLQTQINTISLTPGPAGPTGATGATGAAGAAGSVWRDGVGVPSNGTGVDGDWYLNRSNGDYYERVAGSYVLRGNIKGPQGDAGATGSAGSAGATGSAGANGTNGWAPILAVVTDGARRVLQVSDWTGGTGSKPATGDYVGAAGLTAVLASAVDIRGATGANGSNGTNGNTQKPLTVILPGSGDTPTLFYTNAITTLSKITSVVVGSSSPSVTWNLKHATDRSGAGTDLISGNVTTTNTTTGATNNTFTGTIPANSFVWLNIVSVSGTVEQFHITADYS